MGKTRGGRGYRRWLKGGTVLGIAFLAVAVYGREATTGLPHNDPLAPYHLDWTGEVHWTNVASITSFRGATDDERLENGQEALAAQGGGVIYFPPGTYRLHETIRLRDGIVLRGADPVKITDARQEGYDPPTKFEFPRYLPRLQGDGTPISTAFKGIELADPATASHCGVLDIALNHGHIHFTSGPDHQRGTERFVVGCELRNAAQADPDLPNVEKGQRPWQRFPLWHGGAAIELYASENILIANNRLPASGEDNFPMPHYVLLDREGKPTEIAQGVMFDYDDRGGIVANDYCVGGGGGAMPVGTPDLFPWGFVKGIVIRDNYIYCTGRSAIQFCGDGAVCSFNVIRFKPDVVQYTNTGLNLTTGSSTNDNRAVQMRGWRWTVEGNDYEVYRNLSADGKYYINDGEGLMHEGHCNSAIVDSKLINNRGNTYLSLFRTGGIDGLLIQGNTIRTSPKSGTGFAAIFVAADRNDQSFPCRNVRILDNVTAGSGIEIDGSPGEDNVIQGNRHEGPGGKILQHTQATVQDNTGYTVEEKIPPTGPQPGK